MQLENNTITKDMDKKENSIRRSYDLLLKSGMFFEFYPQLTGEWDKDKDFWYEEYHEQMNRIKDTI